MFFSQLTARVKKNKFWRCLWKVRSECVQRQLYEVIWQQRYFTKEDVPSKNKKITYMLLGIWDISHFLYVYKLELPQFQKPLWFSDIESCYLQKKYYLQTKNHIRAVRALNWVTDKHSGYKLLLRHKECVTELLYLPNWVTVRYKMFCKHF